MLERLCELSEHRDTPSKEMQFPISKERGSLIAKRCVIAAIRDSWAVFYRKYLGNVHTNYNVSNSSDSSDYSQFDHLTDEEDGDILDKLDTTLKFNLSQ